MFIFTTHQIACPLIRCAERSCHVPLSSVRPYASSFSLSLALPRPCHLMSAPFIRVSHMRSRARAVMSSHLFRHLSSLFKPRLSASSYSQASPLHFPNFPLYFASSGQEFGIFPNSDRQFRHCFLAARVSPRPHLLVYCDHLDFHFLTLTSSILVSLQRRTPQPSAELAGVYRVVAASFHLVQ